MQQNNIIVRQSLPDLRNTKVDNLNGRHLFRKEAKWVYVYRNVLRQAMDHFGTLDKLRKNCHINIRRIVQGDKPTKNSTYIEDIDITVCYYQDANNTCRDIIELAKGAGINLDIEFTNYEPKSPYLLGPSNRCMLVIRPKKAILLIQFATWQPPAIGRTANIERIYSLPV